MNNTISGHPYPPTTYTIDTPQTVWYKTRICIFFTGVLFGGIIASAIIVPILLIKF